MAYKIGTATNYKGALSDLKDFVSNPNDVSNAVANPGNTGNGDVINEAAVDSAPTETWTLIATSASNFTVAGSVSGGKADATVGSAYDNGIVSFTITAGGIPFIAGDSFTFIVTKVMGTEKWEILDFNTNYDGSGGYRTYFKGPGSTGTDEIYVGIQTVENSGTPYYCWILGGFTNWQIGETFYTQQGARLGNETLLPWVLLDNQPMKYWFFANGRRIMGVIRVGTIYASFYLGFPLVYGFPSAYPYPLVIGGSSAYSSVLADRQFSSTNPTHRGFPDPYTAGYNNSSSLMVLNGVWLSFGNYMSDAESTVRQANCVWPGSYSECSEYSHYSNKMIWWGDPTPDGIYSLFPLILCQEDLAHNILGELQEVFQVHGDGVVAEDDISFGGNTYKVFQNTYHTAPHNFFAMKLE
jgi:hypothetical protein